ncbi:MAG: citramalate synthase [Candidatus Omnitrophica bacterium]|nr:citramalate synthase [Candidatus Omnitrophota bacterium]
MNKKRVYIYDTTLRDGSQTEGISYSAQDKINIAKKLDDFGVDFIEGGWPFSNPKDKELFDYFKKNPLKKSKLVPFGSTAHPAHPASEDENLLSLVSSGTEYVTIFGKTWDLHVKEVLKIKPEDNLRIISDSVAFLKKKGKRVFYDAEHFFDGYKSNSKYALETLAVAIKAGAELIIFCDTNGGTLPWEVKEIAAKVKADLALDSFGIHCHNDLGLAVANSVSSVDQGCCHIQGTINGYGERCGNADLISIMGILQLKMGQSVVSPKKMEGLVHLSHFVSEVSNMVHRDNHPFIGRSAFAHKGGVHIDAVIKNPLAYEHLEPKKVGNKSRFVVSELAGKSTLVVKAKELDFDLDKKSKQAKDLHSLIQKLENQGYQFEAAEASFKLLLEKELKKCKKFFDLVSFKTVVEKREDGKMASEATIKLKIKDKMEQATSEGDGPVNALDAALRKVLAKFYPTLASMHLTDFKVRVLDEKSGTAAKVRVLIQSQDEKDNWSTIGVSENIIEASWQALLDSVEYKLLKDTKKPS